MNTIAELEAKLKEIDYKINTQRKRDKIEYMYIKRAVIQRQLIEARGNWLPKGEDNEQDN